MYLLDPIDKLNYIKRQISLSSKFLGISQPIISLPVYFLYFKFYFDITFFLQGRIEFQIDLVSFFFFFIVFPLLVFFRYLHLFRLVKAFRVLSSLPPFSLDLESNNALKISNNIKQGAISEIVVGLFSFILIIILMYLTIFSAALIACLPFIFYFFGFRKMSNIFQQLRRVEMYEGQFTNVLSYSQMPLILSRISTIIGGTKLLIAWVFWALGGQQEFNEEFFAFLGKAFLNWFLVAVSLLIIGHILYFIGFFLLNREIKKIKLIKETSLQPQNFLYRINTYSDAISSISEKKDQSAEPKIDTRSDKINGSKTASLRFCPNCGKQNDNDAIFCSECGTNIEVKDV